MMRRVLWIACAVLIGAAIASAEPPKARFRDVVVDNSLTLGGVTRTDWPQGGGALGDNSVTYNHIIFPTDGGYVRFDNSYSAGVIFGLYSTGSPTIRSLIELDDSGEVYWESVRPDFTAFGEVDFSPSANRALMRVYQGTPLVFGGDNVLITLNDIGRTPTAQLEVDGGLRLNTTLAKPTCDSTQRGTLWFTQGGAGVKDTLEVCAKDASGTYAWRTLY